MNVIGELTSQIADLPYLELPYDLKPGAPSRRDGVRDRHHAAEVRFANFANIVLHDKRLTYGLDVDRHGLAVVSHGRTRSDMRVRAALVLSVGKVEKPVSNVHLLDG